MSVAARVRQLLDTHGHSFAGAEKITGVSRETIRRICTGHSPAKLRLYLRKIAEGYGVEELVLLEGATPQGDFEWLVRHASAAQRLDWLTLTPAQRVKLTLDFLQVRYPQAVSSQVLAAAIGVTDNQWHRMWEQWEVSSPDRATAIRLAVIIHEMVGISLAWFEWGRLSVTWDFTDQPLRRIVVRAHTTWPNALQRGQQFLQVSVAP